MDKYLKLQSQENRKGWVTVFWKVPLPVNQANVPLQLRCVQARRCP